ncbi:hypothetical protein J3E74DRAFT_41878 [Bipolaris maydis]|nr:hypothetical protein J3E74DRAFT_41878 [Bipolaris maydis]
MVKCPLWEPNCISAMALRLGAAGVIPHSGLVRIWLLSLSCWSANLVVMTVLHPDGVSAVLYLLDLIAILLHV